MEVENTGTTDIRNVTIEARARNSDGGAISDATATLDLIAAGSSELVTITFCCTYGSGNLLVTGFEYTINSEDGIGTEGRFEDD